MIDTSDLRTLREQDQVARVVTRLFSATDARDWAAVRRCLADSVRFDLTSLAGGKPTTLTPTEITDAWDAGLRPIQHVHHQIGNVVIDMDEDGARVACHGIAYHHRPTASGRNTRVCVGTYALHLVRGQGKWRIDAFRFDLRFVDGNRDLEKEP